MPYADDPADVARDFVRRGARWLHVVDLDRAFGTGHNDEVVRTLCGLAGVRVEVGGNLTDPRYVRTLVAWGARRTVFATAAVLEPEILSSLVDASGRERAAVAIDVRAGQVAMRSANGPVGLDPSDVVGRGIAHGVSVFVYRDLAQEGLLSGGDLEGAAQLVGTGAHIILAGGVARPETLQAAKARGLAGVIIGRALHEGRFTLEEALACS